MTKKYDQLKIEKHWLPSTLIKRWEHNNIPVKNGKTKRGLVVFNVKTKEFSIERIAEKLECIKSKFHNNHFLETEIFGKTERNLGIIIKYCENDPFIDDSEYLQHLIYFNFLLVLRNKNTMLYFKNDLIEHISETYKISQEKLDRIFIKTIIQYEAYKTLPLKQ